MHDKAFTVEMSRIYPQLNYFLYASLDFPAAEHEIRDAMQKIRATKETLEPKVYTVYNCWAFPQHGEVEIGPATLDELNFLAKRMESLDESEMSILKAVAPSLLGEDGQAPINIKDFINTTYGLGTVSVISNVRTHEQLGEFVIENELQADIAKVPKEATYLLDKAQIGRLQRQMDGGVFMDSYYICTDDFTIPEVYDGITLPETEPEPWYAFQLQVSEMPKGNKSTIDTAEWISLPMTQKEMKEVAARHGAKSLSECEFYDFKSSISQITTEDFTSMKDIDTLNRIAKRMVEMSPEEQVKFKAALEAEKNYNATLSDMENTSQNLHQYQFTQASDSAGSFFKEYLSHHTDSKFDPRWFDSLMCYNEGAKLLSKLGASVTDYGVISSWGGSLYDLVPYGQEQSNQKETPSEDMDEGEEPVLQM